MVKIDRWPLFTKADMKNYFEHCNMVDEEIESQLVKFQLLKDYMDKCPFIEYHAIKEIDQEIAVIRVAFDTNIEEWKYKG